MEEKTREVCLVCKEDLTNVKLCLKHLREILNENILRGKIRVVDAYGKELKIIPL